MATSQPSRVSVLLIEDNMDVADSLARFLREQGVDAGVIRTAWEDEGGDDHE